MSRFAQNTDVSTDRSRTEIERTLVRYGAESFMYGWEGTQAMLGFRFKGHAIRFLLPIPAKDDPEFTETPTGRDRSTEAAQKGMGASH